MTPLLIVLIVLVVLAGIALLAALGLLLRKCGAAPSTKP